jgi:hypothetical protein
VNTSAQTDYLTDRLHCSPLSPVRRALFVSHMSGESTATAAASATPASASSSSSSARRASRALFVFAAFLLVCGFIGFGMGGFAAKAKTALIVGGGSALAVSGVGFLMRSQSEATAAAALQAARLICLGLLCVFAWRAKAAWSVAACLPARTRPPLHAAAL